MPFKDPAKKKRYMRRYRKEWYNKNGKKHRKVVAAGVLRRRSQKRAAIDEYLKEHPCVVCGLDDIVVLEFDHVRGKKIKDVSLMLRDGHSMEKIWAEISKCDVVCANDHRRRTAERGLHHRFLVQRSRTEKTAVGVVAKLELVGPITLSSDVRGEKGAAMRPDENGVWRVLPIK